MLELKINKCIIIEKAFVKCMKRTDNDYNQCKHIYKQLNACYNQQFKQNISQTKTTSYSLTNFLKLFGQF